MRSDVAVIGGGLGGLTAAILLRRAGKTVAVLERANDLGGRARSTQLSEFTFNLGPHAIYSGGRGTEVLAELGAQYTGGSPGGPNSLAIRNGAQHILPGGPASVAATTLLNAEEKAQYGQVFGALRGLDLAQYMSMSLDEYCARHVPPSAVREMFLAFIRLTSYVNAPAHMSAGAAFAQMRVAQKKSVVYVDGGWQSLVNELRRIALAAGVELRTGARAEAVEHDAQAVRGVRLAGGEVHDASTVVLATGSPQLASELVDGGRHAVLRRWASEAVPARAACLDVALDQLPRPQAVFAIGVDKPTYLSVHSIVAKLAPPGKVIAHVAQYLAPGSDGEAALPELERTLDLLQPGWREHVVERRFLPEMTVIHGIPTAAQGGYAGRPGPEVPGLRGLYVVGDWVGLEGMLADASLTSAAQVARLAGWERAAEPAGATRASA